MMVFSQNTGGKKNVAKRHLNQYVLCVRIWKSVISNAAFPLQMRNKTRVTRVAEWDLTTARPVHESAAGAQSIWTTGTCNVLISLTQPSM